MKFKSLVSLIFLSILVSLMLIGYNVCAAEPKLSDIDLRVQKVVDGLDYPTTIAFLGKDDFLVLEKDSGTVRRVSNGQLLAQPLLDLNVSNGEGRGLLGIEILKTDNKTYVFLSYLASSKESDFDDFGNGSKPLGNILYRYELTYGNELANPLLLRNLTALPGVFHYGGILTIDQEGYVYHVVGDNGPGGPNSAETRAKNILNGKEPDGTAGISWFTYNGSAPPYYILGKEESLRKYFAYGIRNSFGMAFDPLTEYLWISENGPEYGDEINLVEPGFNSGWNIIHGMPTIDNARSTFKFDPLLLTYIGNNTSSIFPFDFLDSFGGKGKYSDPEFVFQRPVGVTAIAFLNSTKLGENYTNDMFVGDINHGRIYHFKLSPDRMSLKLEGPLSDKISNSNEVQDVLFAEGFKGVSDLKVSPDGYLYVVSHRDGAIYKIMR